MSERIKIERIHLWRGLLAASALGLAWISLVNGVGDHAMERVERGDKDALEAALGWRPNHPELLLAEAKRIMSRNQTESVRLLEQAYRADPTDPQPLTALATLSLLEELQLTQGTALIEAAARLAPASADNHRAIAIYWSALGRYDRMLEHWSAMLEADRSRRTQIYPALLAIAADPGSRALIEPLVAAQPSWWTDFFRQAASTARELETVRFLYTLRRRFVRDPVSEEERVAFVERLQKDGAIGEAYVVWISGLDANARARLGRLFDGGFDLPIEGRGFGWRISTNKHFSAAPEPTLGASGRAALRLRFRAFEGDFANVSQPLFLDPGTYRLSGRAKVDSLISLGGLRWVVRCLRPESRVLGEGPRFLGSSEWAAFDLSFEVPQDCDYQQLVLMAAGSRSFERKFNGDLWFDDLKIARVSALDAAARADALIREQEHSVEIWR